MARNISRRKMGYYPLPPSEAVRIRGCLSFPDHPFSAFDPCVGTGAALMSITEGADVRLYGVELDADRAAAANAAGIDTLHADAMNIGGSSEQVSVLYLNPPYDFECGTYGNRRLEERFLSEHYRFLKKKGVLVFVIPRERLGACATILSREFTDVQAFLLTDEESLRFDQIVVFARRGYTASTNAARVERALYAASTGSASIPCLTPSSAPLYEIPRSGVAHFIDKGLPLDQIEDLIINSRVWSQLKSTVVPSTGVFKGRPLTPLHAGQVGLTCIAGLLNGFFGQGKDRHLARWRTRKVSYTTEEYDADAKETIQRTTERFEHDNALVFENGRTLILTATGQESGKDVASANELRQATEEDVGTAVECSSAPLEALEPA